MFQPMRVRQNKKWRWLQRRRSSMLSHRELIYRVHLRVTTSDWSSHLAWLTWQCNLYIWISMASWALSSTQLMKWAAERARVVEGGLKAPTLSRSIPQYCQGMPFIDLSIITYTVALKRLMVEDNKSSNWYTAILNMNSSNLWWGSVLWLYVCRVFTSTINDNRESPPGTFRLLDCTNQF